MQLTQFHIPYYASRTLPNTFALLLTTTAYACLLPSPGWPAKAQRNHQVLGLLLLTTTAVVFRSEVALLLAFQALHLLLSRRLPFSRILAAGIAGGVFALTATLAIDSYFWLSYTANPIFTTPLLTEYTGLLWPELSGFWFNAVQGQASAWGESPWHYYFTSALPKLLLNPATLLTLPLGASTTHSSSALLLPAAAFVAIYSLLVAHKEWRFVVYIIPQVTLVSAQGAAWCWNRRQKGWVYLLLALCVAGSIPATLLASMGMLAVSGLNYPGGHAISAVHAHIPHNRAVRVHLDVATCMTGATRFLQEAPLWPTGEEGSEEVLWDKTEDVEVLAGEGFWEGMDFRIVERAVGGWVPVEVVGGFGGAGVYAPGKEVAGVFWGVEVGGWRVGIVVRDMVWVLKRGGVEVEGAIA